MVTNAYVKAFVLETKDKAHPGPWEKQPTSWGTAKDYCLRTSGGHLGHCVPGRERQPPHLGNS